MLPVRPRLAHLFALKYSPFLLKWNILIDFKAPSKLSRDSDGWSAVSGLNRAAKGWNVILGKLQIIVGIDLLLLVGENRRPLLSATISLMLTY
jgi:hypothetical protein